MIRLSKALLVCAIAFFASLVAFGNITDYATNFQFVHHVLMMDTIFPNASIHYRAIETPWLQKAGYILIITMETATAILCWVGGLRLLFSLKKEEEFYAAKKVAVAGLTLGFLVWQVGFMSVGGEWFGMWMSHQWNGVPDAFRFFVTIILVLIYLIQPDT